MSCKTTEVQKQIEYIYVVPEVIWPDFPDISDVSYNEEDDTVTVTGDFWADLAIYKRGVDKIKNIYMKAGENN